MIGTDVMASIVGVAGLAAIGLIAAATVRIPDKAGFIVAALTFIAASVVLISTALSFAELYRRGPFLVAELAVLLAVGAAWWASGRRRPPAGWLRLPSMALAGARKHRSVALIAAAATVAFVVEAVLAIGVVPNNFDSMTYHLSRAAYWLQHQSVLQFDGGSSWQLQYGPNAEILQAWTMLFTNGDRFTQLVQWSAHRRRLRDLRRCSPAGVLPPRLRLRRRPLRHPAAARAGGLEHAERPGGGVLRLRHRTLCSSGDRGPRSRRGGGCGDRPRPRRRDQGHRPDRRAGAAADHRGGTVEVATPTQGGERRSRRARGRRRCARQRQLRRDDADTGSPFGSAADAETRTVGLAQSGLRTLWSFVDAPGFAGSWIGDAVNAATQRAVGGDPASFAPFSGTEIEEDVTGYGPLGLLVLLPLFAWFAFAPATRPSRRIAAWAALLYIATHVLLLEPDPFAARTLMIGVALGAPLLARVHGIPWLRHATVVVAVLFLVPALFYNYRKPLRPDSVLGLDRAAQQSAWTPAREPTLRAIDAALANTDRVGVISSNDGWDYPMFGPHFDRYVVRRDFVRDLDRDPGSLSTLEFIEANDLDAVVWAEVPPPADVRVPDLGPPGLSYFVYKPE